MPKSELIKTYLEHTWIIKCSGKTLLPVILTQVCDKFSYVKGFEPGVQKKDFHLTLGFRN